MYKLGILVSSELEAQAFDVKDVGVNAVPINESVFLSCCAPNGSNLDEALASLMSQNINAIISFGFAGGLAPEATTGSVMIPKQIVDPYGETIDCDPKLQSDTVALINKLYPAHEGALSHSYDILFTPTSKSFLNQRTHCQAVDQESLLIARKAKEMNLPMVAVRVVLDDSETTLPEDIATLQNADGQLQPGKIIRALLKPHLWHQYIILNTKYRRTQEVLRSVAQSALIASSNN